MFVGAGHFFGGGVCGIFERGYGVGAVAGMICVGREILGAGIVANVEEEAPEEICGESAEKDDDESGESLPEDGGAVADADGFDGVGGGEAVGEAGAHDPRKCGDEETFFQVEFFDRGAFLFFRHFAFFYRAGGADENDAEHADADSDENCYAGACAENFRGELAAENWWHERAEGGGEAERYGHTERHAEVAHREAEGEAAESPENAEDVGPGDSGARRIAQNADEIAGQQRAQEPRRDDPTENSADEPVGFPGPTFHFAVRHVEAA